jgi:Ribonuclease G/E
VILRDIIGCEGTTKEAEMHEQRAELQIQEPEEHTCSHCYGTGWVVMGVENDFGKYEEYYALCRKCARAYNEREGTPA